MNGNDLLLGLNYVEESMIEEAEMATAQNNGTAKIPLRRALLIAAIVTILLLLMGCTILYLSSIQSVRLGEKQLFYDRYDPLTFEYMGRHYYTVQVFSPTGNENSSSYRAAQEWFSFIQSYDPYRTIQKAIWSNPPEFPSEYDSYNIYTQEMKDKLDAITKKYGLQLAGKQLDLHTVFELCNFLGIEQSVISHPTVFLSVRSGTCYENGNFSLNLDFSFRDTLDTDQVSTYGNLTWNRADCFTDHVLMLEDTDDWAEWTYTTTDGNNVLIVRSPSSSHCYIIINRNKGIMSVDLETRYYQDWDNDANSRYLSNAQVEQIADIIDTSLCTP